MLTDTKGAVIVTSKLRPALSRLPYLLRALGLVWAASRGWMVAWVALLAVQGLLPAATVYLTRALVNSLVAVVSSGGDWATLMPALPLVLLMAGIILLTQLLSSNHRHSQFTGHAAYVLLGAELNAKGGLCQ